MNLEFAGFVMLGWFGVLGTGFLAYLCYQLLWAWPCQLCLRLKRRIHESRVYPPILQRQP